jgi:hypothetical protein
MRQASAERLEDELGPEQPMFIDGGYVHSSQQRSRRDGWFEVIAGKSLRALGPSEPDSLLAAIDARLCIKSVADNPIHIDFTTIVFFP